MIEPGFDAGKSRPEWLVPTGTNRRQRRMLSCCRLTPDSCRSHVPNGARDLFAGRGQPLAIPGARVAHNRVLGRVLDPATAAALRAGRGKIAEPEPTQSGPASRWFIEQPPQPAARIGQLEEEIRQDQRSERADPDRPWTAEGGQPVGWNGGQGEQKREYGRHMSQASPQLGHVLPRVTIPGHGNSPVRAQQPKEKARLLLSRKVH